jgi:hypothetical protein
VVFDLRDGALLALRLALTSAMFSVSNYISSSVDEVDEEACHQRILSTICEAAQTACAG